MKRLLIFVSFGIGMTLSGLGMGLSAAYLYLNPQVPDISTFTEVNLKAPLKILSRDRKLIQEYGERLIPITFEQIPRDFITKP